MSHSLQSVATQTVYLHTLKDRKTRLVSAAALHGNAIVSFDKDDDDIAVVAALASMMKRRTHKLNNSDGLVKQTSSPNSLSEKPDGLHQHHRLWKQNAMPLCMSKCKASQFYKGIVNMMHSDILLFHFLFQRKSCCMNISYLDLSKSFSIPWIEILSRKLNSCHHIDSVKGEWLPYPVNVYKFANGAELIFVVQWLAIGLEIVFTALHDPFLNISSTLYRTNYQFFPMLENFLSSSLIWPLDLLKRWNLVSLRVTVTCWRRIRCSSNFGGGGG